LLTRQDKQKKTVAAAGKVPAVAAVHSVKQEQLMLALKNENKLLRGKVAKLEQELALVTLRHARVQSRLKIDLQAFKNESAN